MHFSLDFVLVTKENQPAKCAKIAVEYILPSHAFLLSFFTRDYVSVRLVIYYMIAGYLPLR